MKYIFRTNTDTLTIVTINTTSNKKIAAKNEKILQTSHFSREQFNEAKGKTTMKDFFSQDKKVCFDCPFAVSNGAKLSACYTHKVMQYSGFLSSLRSIKYDSFDQIPMLTNDIHEAIVTSAQNKFVRFGTYGEPTLLPINLVRDICAVAKNWTGYSHQWQTKNEYSLYFMASTHTEGQQLLAEVLGWRSFVATDNIIDKFVKCPASKEMGFVSNCSKCGLCSGTEGKGKKSITILTH